MTTTPNDTQSHKFIGDKELNESQWDCCVIGDGVSALWLAHWLWRSKKSVLWITSDNAYAPSRVFLQHAWHWGVPGKAAEVLTNSLNPRENLPLFESIYFDVRSSAKRFRKFVDEKGELKVEWGKHEKELLLDLVHLTRPEQTQAVFDLWDWHQSIYLEHNVAADQAMAKIELSSEPRFVRVQGWPLLELTTANKRITGAVLAGESPETSISIQAETFFLADYDEYLPSFIKNSEDADLLAANLKGRAFRAGFGFQLWHKPLGSYPVQTAVIPLIVNPEKGAGSHVIGRFVATENGLESFWAGILTDEEVEDNNEILKKIKQAKRAIDRAIPGFAESIEREAVTFEPRMRATSLLKRKKSALALGAVVVSDQFGSEAVAELISKVITGDLESVSDEDQDQELASPDAPAPAPKKSRATKRAAEQSL